MIDPSPTIGPHISLVLAALGAISALFFWRSSALGPTLAAVGKIRRVSMMVPLTVRLRHLYTYNLIRVALFIFFLICISSCIYILYRILEYRSLIAGPKPPDPGLVELIVERLHWLSVFSLRLILLASVCLFVEWGIDAWCQYLDLDASLAVTKIQGHAERPETRYFQLEPYTDMLALWQARIRYCVEAHNRQDLAQLLERLGDSDLTWQEFSKAICEFRAVALLPVTGAAK